MKECESCGTIRPDSQERCDCGGTGMKKTGKVFGMRGGQVFGLICASAMGLFFLCHNSNEPQAQVKDNRTATKVRFITGQGIILPTPFTQPTSPIAICYNDRRNAERFDYVLPRGETLARFMKEDSVLLLWEGQRVWVIEEGPRISRIRTLDEANPHYDEAEDTCWISSTALRSVR